MAQLLSQFSLWLAERFPFVGDANGQGGTVWKFLLQFGQTGWRSMGVYFT